jgi:hypothetical protein
MKLGHMHWNPRVRNRWKSFHLWVFFQWSMDFYLQWRYRWISAIFDRRRLMFLRSISKKSVYLRRNAHSKSYFFKIELPLWHLSEMQFKRCFCYSEASPMPISLHQIHIHLRLNHLMKNRRYDTHIPDLCCPQIPSRPMKMIWEPNHNCELADSKLKKKINSKLMHF